MIFDVLIIGGGAAGLACGVKCAESGLKCAILERGEAIGKKILVTGNGRCNLTNLSMGKENFHSEFFGITENILGKYPPEKIISFFNSIGLLTSEKSGYVYPYSNQAASVRDTFMVALKKYEVSEICNFQVKDILKKKNFYEVYDIEGKKIAGRNVVVATGAKAYNGSGAGSGILKSFGHELIPFYPAIVQLKSDSPFVKGLKGVRFSGIAKAFCDGEFVAEEKGEILFTEYGISGIAVMQLSRLFSKAEKMSVFLDFMPEKDYDEVYNLLLWKKEFIDAGYNTEELFTGILNKNLGRNIVAYAGVNKVSAEKLSLQEIGKIASSVKSVEIEIKDTNGFKNAQACGGGIKLEGFDSNLQSKLSKGLYACGEVLDICGDCGGYNLHWAWASGLRAAEGIIENSGENYAENI